MLLTVVAAMIIIMILIELKKLFKSREWLVCIVYSFMLALLLLSAIFVEFGVKFPNPMDPVEKIITSIIG